MESDIRQGHCLCGAVTFEATITSPSVQLCHCAQCRRWTGGGALSVVRVQDATVTGEDHIGRYHASAHGERGFCQSCGTTLFWKMKGGSLSFLPVGLFDDQSGLEVKEEIFVDCRPDWMPPYAGANQSTEAEQMQLFADYMAKKSGGGA